MVLVGLLPLLALASTSSVSGMPIDSPPASPALSLQGGGSATFSPVPSFSPQMAPSPTFPSAINVPSPQLPSTDPGALAPGDINSFGAARGAAGVGRGKGMTNAERMRRGLGIFPPTRRMTGKPARRSGIPSQTGDQAQDLSQGQDPDQGQMDDPASPDPAGGNGQSLAAKKYVMRMSNPDDGSDMGMITMPDDSNGDGGLVGSDPNGNPLTTTFPSDPTSTPFQIAPASPGAGGDDGDTFSGPSRMLAAVPHGGNGDLGQGRGDYANLGMGWKDATGLLHVSLRALLHSPSSGSSAADGATSNDPTLLGAGQQLLSHPGSTPDNGDKPGPLPTDQILGSDPTRLLHIGVNDLPDVLGSSGPSSGGVTDSALTPQSALWTFHPQSSRLLAHYVNSDGHTVPTYLVTGGECAHTICLTADIDAFKNEHGADAHEVHIIAEVTADL
ncbi:hypothetical protein IAU60_006758 [Kwoniella sp. DSM 27419]